MDETKEPEIKKPEAKEPEIKELKSELSKNSKEANEKLEIAIVKIIREQPIYGFILTRMRRIQGQHLVPTMGVRPTVDKYIQLVYNPDFVVEKLSDTQLIAVLEHEVLHILNEHPLRRRSREHEQWNIACDMAINQYIKGLPDDCITLPKGLEALREAEYYYQSEQVAQMAQQMKQQGGFCPNGCSRGDHSGWDPMDGEIEMQSRIRELVSGAVEDAKRQGRGTLPAHLEEMIRRIMEKPIRWQNLLRRCISEEISPDPEETFRRPHRRRMYEVNGKMEDIFPGFKRAPLAQLTCAFDTSGSMGNDDLGECLNELAHLARSYGDIKLIHADADVMKVERYTGKNEIVMHGRGGTSFTPTLDYMMKQPVKEGCKPTLIYFTDGMGDNPADNGYTKRFDTIWVITRNGTAERVAQFGKIIQMEKHRRA